MHSKTIILSSILFTLFLATSGLAIQITPGLVYYDYEPGTTHKQSFTVSEIHGDSLIFSQSGPVTLELPGEVSIPQEQDSYPFEVEFTIPEGLDPGKTDIRVRVKDVLNGDAQISADPVIVGKIVIRRPYPGKYAALAVEYEQEVTAQDPLQVKVKASSIGKETIESLQGTLEITSRDTNEHIASVPFGPLENIAPETFKSMDVTWDASQVTPGPYQFRTVATYDGGATRELDDRYFSVGEETINVVDLTPLEVPVDQVVPLKATVKSVWNSPLQYSAELVLKQGDTVVKEVRSSQNNLKQSETQQADLFLDTNGLELGEYTAQVSAVYSDKKTSKDFTINIVEKSGSNQEGSQASSDSDSDDGDSSTWLYVGIVVAVLVVLLLLFFVWKRRKDNDGDEYETGSYGGSSDEF